MGTKFICKYTVYLSKAFHFQVIQFSQTVLIQTIQFSIKTVPLQVIQFSISTQFSSIWPIDWALSSAITPGQSGPGSNVNEGVFGILQSFSNIETSPSDCLVSYPEHSLVGSYTSAEVSVAKILWED